MLKKSILFILIFSAINFLSFASDNRSQINYCWYEPFADPTHVGKFDKLELGFKLPGNITGQVNKFIQKSSGGINPFDPEQIDFRIKLTNPKGQTIMRYAFYYQPFIEDLEQDAFIPDTTTYPWRFRFAPDEIGNWSIEVSVIIKGSETISHDAITFTCVNSEHPGVLLVTKTNTEGDRWLKFSENNKTFFAVTNNIASGGFCAYLPTQNRRQMEGVQQLIEAGGNFTRFELGGQAALPDWPVYNDYKGKFDEMYAFDRLVDLCENNNVYFTVFRHHVEVLDGSNPNEHSWDGMGWFDNPYRNGLNLEAFEDYFTNEDVIKWQNNNLRYIFSRWGYSPNFAFYSYSEIDRWYSKLFEDEEQRKTTGINAINDGGTRSENESIETMRTWIKNQQDYIKTNFNSKMMFCHSYAAVPKIEKSTRNKGLFDLSDVIAVHNYGEVKNINYKKRYDQLEQYWLLYQKPVVMEEMGIGKLPIHCCTGVDYHNSIWATAMMGDFGTGMDWWWDRGIHDFNYQVDLKIIGLFFNNIDLKNGNYTPQKWQDVASVDLANYAAIHRKIENYALKRADSEHVIGWIHNATFYWRNLANELPCLQELVDSNKLLNPCYVAKNKHFNPANVGEINICEYSEKHNVNLEINTEYDHSRYKDHFTDKGGAIDLGDTCDILKNPIFVINDLKPSFGAKKNWYKIEYYYTKGNSLVINTKATQVLHTNSEGELKPHVPLMNANNPDYAYKIVFVGRSKRKADILSLDN